ncbi:MAG: hypothetical protein ABJL44_01595 [Algibacter sp.]
MTKDIYSKLEKMETLEYKIFDVLTEKISVLEFENWLYNYDEFISQINVNAFYFDVISINYKSDSWSKALDNLIKEKYDEDFMILHRIKRSCLNILKSENTEEVYQILKKLVTPLDYNTDYSVLWEFYSIKEYYKLFKEGLLRKNNFNEEAKFYAKQVIDLTQNCRSFEETKQSLIKDLKPFKTSEKREKQSLKQKIFAFFKKI